MVASFLGNIEAVRALIGSQAQVNTRQKVWCTYSATDYKIPKLTFVFIEFLRQYDVCYWYVLYTKMILNYH